MGYLDDPSVTITQFFPSEPFNFEIPPPNTTIGPLKAIFNVIGQRQEQYVADVLLLQSQMIVQTAAGKYLDLHGACYGIPRMTIPSYELDDPYRARILNGTYKLTIPAIQAVVVAYYKAIRPVNKQPRVYVYDLQSDPIKSAAIGLKMFGFVIDVAFPVSAKHAFFTNRSFTNRHDFLINPEAVLTQPSDEFIAAQVRNTKAANTKPIWRIHSFIVTPT